MGYTPKGVSTTVLIGPPEHLPALQERHHLGKTDAFADTDALRALDTITRERPKMVAIERGFAATSRGTALIERVKADPRLTACEIRVVAYDSDYARVSPTHVKEAGDLAAATAATPVGTHAVPPAVAPLDQRGTRRAPRFKIVAGVVVRFNGIAASLVNLSMIGASANDKCGGSPLPPTRNGSCRCTASC